MAIPISSDWPVSDLRRARAAPTGGLRRPRGVPCPRHQDSCSPPRVSPSVSPRSRAQHHEVVGARRVDPSDERATRSLARCPAVGMRHAGCARAVEGVRRGRAGRVLGRTCRPERGRPPLASSQRPARPENGPVRGDDSLAHLRAAGVPDRRAGDRCADRTRMARPSARSRRVRGRSTAANRSPSGLHDRSPTEQVERSLEPDLRAPPPIEVDGNARDETPSTNPLDSGLPVRGRHRCSPRDAVGDRVRRQEDDLPPR